MDEKRYRRTITALLIAIAILFLSFTVLLVCIIRQNLLLRTEPDAPTPSDVPGQRDELLMASDLLPDEEKWLLSYDGTLVDAQGRETTLSTFRGKPAVLLFFSSWCPDCQAYLQGDFAEAAHAAETEGATVLLICREGVKGDTAEQAVQELTACGLGTERLWMDPQAALYTQMGLHGVPSLAVLDAQGVLLFAQTEMPDAQEMQSLLQNALSPEETTLSFLQAVQQESGAIMSSYQVRADGIVPGQTVLSETMGLVMCYAAEVGNEALFRQCWDYVQSEMSVDGLTAWCIEGDKRGAVNASLDDLRILSALMAAQERWGGYEEIITQRARALYDACVVRGYLMDYASLEEKRPSGSVALCYQDTRTMRALSAYDARWAEVAENATALFADERALVSDQLPLYRAMYDPVNDTYSEAAPQMTEAAIAVFYAAQSGAVQEKTLAWLEAELSSGALYAWYGDGGAPLNGYRYEASGTYAILAQLGCETQRREMARLSMCHLESQRNRTGTANGAYGSTTGDVSYVFDEAEALLTWQMLRRTENESGNLR